MKSKGPKWRHASFQENDRAAPVGDKTGMVSSLYTFAGNFEFVSNHP
jgi:hypothetical protein